MCEGITSDGVASARDWLRGQTGLVQRARHTVADGADINRALLSDPTILVDLAAEIAREAAAAGAPRPVLALLQARATQWSSARGRASLRPLRGAFAGLSGDEPPARIVDVLRLAASKASDESSRTALDTAATAAEHLNAGTALTSMRIDWNCVAFCCAVGFVEAGVGCIVAGAAAALLC